MQDSSNLHPPATVFNGAARGEAEGRRDIPSRVSRDPLTLIDIPHVLTQPLEPIPFVVEPWLILGDVVCLGGDPKSGKSLLSQTLALALATGTRFLGSLPIKGGPYRVLYLDAENNPRLIQRRLKRLASGLGLEPDRFLSAPLRYVSCPGLNLDDDQHLLCVLRMIEAFQPNILILDSFVRFHRRNENSNSEMSAFFCDRLKPLSEPSGAGLYLQHHLAKPSEGFSARDIVHRFRGASDIAAEADQLWGLERTQDGERTLTHERTRWEDTALPLSFGIQDANDGQGVLLIATELEACAETVIREELRGAAARGALRKDLVKAVRAAGFKSAERIVTTHLGRMHKRAEIRKRPEGKEARYWLSEHTPQGAD